MDRRDFIRNATVLGTATLGGLKVNAGEKLSGKIMTVTGPIGADEMGFTLPHEHILVDFVGADMIQPGRYDPEVVMARAVPHLKELKSLGVNAFVECTPAFIGRDPVLMKRISMESGVKILTNTGFYNAREGFFVPRKVEEMTPEQLAEIWIDEWKNGIVDTGVRPGFIKIAVNRDGVNPQGQKIVRAAAITHRETGLRIHSHTGRNPVSGYQQLEILKEEGVSPSAWTWVHATGVQPLDQLQKAFEEGAWLSFDNMRPTEDSVQRMLNCIQHSITHGWLDQILVSHDAGWYVPGQPGGGQHRSYTAYFTHLLPAAKKAGIPSKVLDKISITNPARNFAIGKHLL